MKKYILVFIAILSIILYSLTLRGTLGVPNPEQIEFSLSQSGQAFETSQERSRYAIILSLVNYHTFNIDHYASMGTPDVGTLRHHYFSFFPIATSVLAIPLYLLGLKLGATQLFVFSISTIFAFLTVLLIAKFCLRLGLHWSIALFSAVSFGFATNAWGYSVTLYAHLLSAFFILLGFYITGFYNKNHRTLQALAVWFIYGIAVFIDYPNLFIYAPIVIILSRHLIKQTEKNSYFTTYRLQLKYILTPIIFVLLMVAYGYYNETQYGSPTVLSNAIPRVKDLKVAVLSIPESTKNAGQALNTRNIVEGLHSFTISTDRGLLIYSPVVLLGVCGIGFFKDKRKLATVGLLAIPLTCLTLYTMFGDPYGGWAFGSRYMIAILPELCILAGIGLQRFGKNIMMKIGYSIVFIYSAGVSLLSPLTTNVIPPYVEARNVGLDSSYVINMKMLEKSQLNSFLYNTYFHAIPGYSYYFLILSVVVAVGMFAIWYPKKGVYETSTV